MTIVTLKNKVADAEDGRQTRAWKLPGPITLLEMASAQLTPECIVDKHIYADVAVKVAPGGVGKTTMEIYEAIHIVLGLPLYGYEVKKPGPVVIVTAEDTREILVARLRDVGSTMGLTTAQMDIVRREVRISDVSGTGLKLTIIAGDIVATAPVIDDIIEECREIRPVLVVLDPAVSLGVGEQRVNDAEQGLIEAARRIRNALNCCVRYVHHSGKFNAREKTLDQYTGRGGSALPDGCRMVAVLQAFTPDEWRKATGMSLADGEQGIVLARPKLSYCAPQPDILIARKGFAFTYTTRTEIDPAAELDAKCAQVLRLIEHATAKGERPTQNSLESRSGDVKMTTREVRGTIATLLSKGQIEHADIEPKPKSGARTYLRVAATPGFVAPTPEKNAA